MASSITLLIIHPSKYPPWLAIENHENRRSTINQHYPPNISPVNIFPLMIPLKNTPLSTMKIVSDPPRWHSAAEEFAGLARAREPYLGSRKDWYMIQYMLDDAWHIIYIYMWLDIIAIDSSECFNDTTVFSICFTLITTYNWPIKHHLNYVSP